MQKKIVAYPNPVLREKAKEITEITPDLLQLAEDMIETMKKGDGVGLAANQVGEAKRIIVVNLGKEAGVFINPKIVKTSKKKQILEEGCLSFPGVYFKIKRPEKVEVEFLNEKGESMKIEAKELLACVFQHEIDHLDGILFIDRLSFWQKLKNLRFDK